MRSLCWWTAPALPPWSPAGPWSAWSWTGLALSASWVPVQTFSNVTSNSTTASSRCLSEGASLSLPPSLPLFFSFLDPGSNDAICFSSLSSSFCWLFSRFRSTHREHLAVTTRHAEVTFSHSPALVPAAVRYLIGTVTSRYLCYVCICWLRFLFRLKREAGLWGDLKDIRVSGQWDRTINLYMALLVNLKQIYVVDWSEERTASSR